MTANTHFKISRSFVSPCISPGPRFTLWLFRNMIRFYGEELLAPYPTPKLEDHPLSVVRDCLLNITAAALYIGGLSSFRNLWTRHAVVTGTHLWRGHCNTTLNLQAPCILYIGQTYRYSPEYSFYVFSQQIYIIIFFLNFLSPSSLIPPQNVVYFLMLPFLVHKIFTFYINDVLNCKCPAPGPKG